MLIIKIAARFQKTSLGMTKHSSFEDRFRSNILESDRDCLLYLISIKQLLHQVIELRIML